MMPIPFFTTAVFPRSRRYYRGTSKYFKLVGDSADGRSMAALGSGMDSRMHGMSERSYEAVAAKISERSRAMFIQLGYTDPLGFRRSMLARNVLLLGEEVRGNLSGSLRDATIKMCRRAKRRRMAARLQSKFSKNLEEHTTASLPGHVNTVIRVVHDQGHFVVLEVNVKKMAFEVWDGKDYNTDFSPMIDLRFGTGRSLCGRS
ncbi:hypothetical protein IV203_002400 [Nitzschia inconspicua]|uniref:Uncharacterized protein n=1 Tax=Nitzschia inconspicua TaxID=303405 RepID=A0A9K3L8P9_9STRA|nr:hypothetical protein IV203_002400 [Nitzschia inconspicua]